MKHINEPLFCYLSKEAAATMKELEEKGVDKDLAFALLDTVTEDRHLFSIEEDEDQA